MQRWLEINDAGFAFHQPDPTTQFLDAPPPTQVLFCDCQGVGVVCHHTYADGRVFTVEGRDIRPEDEATFRKAHADCGPVRRQIFVNVTTRPTARLDGTGATRLRYDEATDAFTVEPIPVTKASKTAFLAAIGPELLAAWFASTDPVLVFGREMFKADTSVDLDSAVIAQVLAQGVKLGLVSPTQAVSVQAAITALPSAVDLAPQPLAK